MPKPIIDHNFSEEFSSSGFRIRDKFASNFLKPLKSNLRLLSLYCYYILTIKSFLFGEDFLLSILVVFLEFVLIFTSKSLRILFNSDNPIESKDFKLSLMDKFGKLVLLTCCYFAYLSKTP